MSRSPAIPAVYESLDSCTNLTSEFWRSEDQEAEWAHSLPLVRPSRACGFAQRSSRSCQVFPLLGSRTKIPLLFENDSCASPGIPLRLSA